MKFHFEPLTLLLYQLTIQYGMAAVVTQTPCSIIRGCNCITTAYETYKYECSKFNAVLKSNNDLSITCHMRNVTNYESKDFQAINLPNLEKLSWNQCPEYLLNNYQNLSSTLKSLNLRENGIGSESKMLPLIKNIANLEELEVTLNEFNISEYLFLEKLKMQKIIFTHNIIKHISPTAFQNLANLKYLDLSNNEIEFLPDTLFLKLGALRYLNLSNNKLAIIQRMLFYDLQNLEEINLSHNEIIVVHREAFQRLINLRVINLSFNFVKFDGFSPFFSNAYLKKVDLSHNKISHITNDLVLNKIQLNELDLSYNHIDSFAFFNLQAMSCDIKINLQNNKIDTINFEHAALVEQMNKLDNTISQYHECVSNINLNYNPITCDCNLYDFIKFLRTESKSLHFQIDRASCALPQALKGFALSEVSLELLTCPLENGNCPISCECSYRQWDSALLIYCDKKNLTDIPDLSTMANIKAEKMEVYLQENLLTSGPGENMGYENVTKLVLSHNQINNIDWIPPKLEILEVEYNMFTALSSKVLHQLTSPQLKKLTLGNNPWKCDCSSMAFNSFLITELTTTKEIDVGNINCMEDKKLLIYHNSEDFCSSGSSRENTTIFVISLLILLLSGLIMFVMIRRIRRNVRLKQPRIV